MKSLLTVIVISALLTPITGRTDGLSYSYWELAYVAADVDGLDDQLDGYGVGVSIELSEQVFFYADFAEVSTTLYDVDVSEQDTGLGLGFAWTVANDIDLIGKVGYAHANLDVDQFGSIGEDGYALGVGVRGRFADSFELESGVRYVDFPDLGDDTSFGAGLQWYFIPDVAISVSGTYNDDATAYSIGVRGTWGR